MNEPGEIPLYQAEDGKKHIDVRLVVEAVGLSAAGARSQSHEQHFAETKMWAESKKIVGKMEAGK